MTNSAIERAVTGAFVGEQKKITIPRKTGSSYYSLEEDKNKRIACVLA